MKLFNGRSALYAAVFRHYVLRQCVLRSLFVENVPAAMPFVPHE